MQDKSSRGEISIIKISEKLNITLTDKSSLLEAKKSFKVNLPLAEINQEIRVDASIHVL